MDMRSILHDWGSWEVVCKNGSFSIDLAYQKMLGYRAKVQWRGLSCDNKASSRTLFIVWLMAHRKLATLDRLCKWGILTDWDL